MRKKDLQKSLYDGKESGYRPVYYDKKEFRAYMRAQVYRAEKNGILGLSLKAAKNLAMLDSLKITGGRRLLDAGCGGGVLLNQIRALYGARCYGVDLSGLAIKRARECGNREIEYKNGKLEKLPYPPGYFDFVVSFDVLEHVEDWKKALSEIHRVLKPGGSFLVYAISQRDLLTWHWFLRLVTFGKFGNDTVGGHFREKFVNPYEAYNRMLDLKVSSVSLHYLHSFFALLTDELLFRMALIAGSGKKKAGIKAKKEEPGVKKEEKAGFKGAVIRGSMRILLLVFETLELPWKLLGLSNGFYLKGKK